MNKAEDLCHDYFMMYLLMNWKQGDMVLEDVMKSENGDLASSYLIS